MPVPLPPLRADLDLLPRYAAGRPPREGAGRAYKLSSNELPFPTDRQVAADGADVLGLANRYPDLTSGELVGRLARQHDVAADQVVVAGGSIAVLQQLIQAATNPGDRVVHAWRSYEAYPILVRVAHAESVTVPLAGAVHDLPAMADAVAATDAAMVIVCNPNNPTGTAVRAEQLEAFLDAVPSSCLVVLDEAYHEFVTDPGVPDGIVLAGERPNVAVLRTFSKAHGLAGLRVGYGVLPAAVADAVRAVALPFGASLVAQRAAVAALDAWPRQESLVREVVARRDRFVADLRDLGLTVPDSQANFAWLAVGDRSGALVAALADEGVSVREFPGEGVRITVGEPEALAITTAVAAGFAGTLGTFTGKSGSRAYIS